MRGVFLSFLYSFRVPKHRFVRHDWLTFAKLRFFWTKVVCHKMTAFNHFKNVIAKNGIYHDSQDRGI